MVQIVRLEEWEWLSVEIGHHVIEAGCDDAGTPLVAAEMSMEGVVFDTRSWQPVPNSSAKVTIQFSAEQQFDDEAQDDDSPDGVLEGCSEDASYIGQIHISVLPLVDQESYQNANGSTDFAAFFNALASVPPGATSERRRLTVYLHLFLPLSVFSTLMSMKGTRIKLSTVHDALTNPKVEGSLYVAAFVKRASFESIEP